MVLLDDGRRLVRANAAAAELLGRPAGDLAGLTVDDLTPDWLRPCLVEGWPEFLRDGSILQRRAVTLPDGSTAEVDYYATANVLPGRHLAVYIPQLSGNGRPGEAARTELTPREREVVQLLAAGLSGAMIAERLVISRETVRTHIRNAMEKTGARTRPHLIAIAIRHGLIRP